MNPSAKAKIYIMGPMTGYYQGNRPRFHQVAEALRLLGFQVVNPAELDEEHGELHNPEAYYARDLPYLADCDAAVALEGWQASTGASLEAVIFKTLGKPIFLWPDLIEYPKDDLPSIKHPVKTAT